MTLLSSIAFAAPAAAGLPRQIPPAGSVLALAAPGLVTTGLACWLFYALIDAAGAATASLITYLTPAVAPALGTGLLAEPPTAAAAAGLVLTAPGAWPTASHPAAPDRPDTSRQQRTTGDDGNAPPAPLAPPGENKRHPSQTGRPPSRLPPCSWQKPRKMVPQSWQAIPPGGVRQAIVCGQPSGWPP